MIGSLAAGVSVARPASGLRWVMTHAIEAGSECCWHPGSVTIATSSRPWPELTLADWADTRETVHRWTQVVGKIRLALEPPVNHWWQVPLYVSARV